MIRGIVYIVIFAAGAGAGALFPSFSTQYHQQLQARYEQVNMDLEPFQKIADRYHGGDLAALVEHHLNSTDPTFYAEGAAIQLMIDSRLLLAESAAAAEAGYTEQLMWLYRNRDESVVQATLDTFEPAVLTNSKTLGFGAATGAAALLIIWAAFNIVTYGFTQLLSLRRT